MSNTFLLKNGELVMLRWANAYDAHNIAVMELASAEYENRVEPIGLTEEAFTNYWTWRLNSHDCPTLVVCDVKQVMGFLSFEKTIASGEIMALYISPNYMHMGIGSILVKTAQDLVLKQGGTALHVDVEIGNATGLLFYEKLGFIKVGMKNDHLIIMKKELSNA